ncbi:ribonuclease P protein component [Sphaerotilus microaerophilus]|uniref:Ribonuclease P protein component n=1 Tax=Sphaerotilus microaerophilus TaxID=2914710 RepID=A0ABM7YFZ5_9BURK|nr:ribonuclease P protein component [Sphaerotilus sp. FB-5]BDI03181.1 ribonuclease P protein component [Sphaerotilus sp. FB-5]
MAQTLSALTASARFEAAMGQRPCARSTHFSVHYLPPAKLSTAATLDPSPPVDDSSGPASGNDILMLGMVVPKRHARRAVTRNLIKRQMRAHVRERLTELPCGEWVLRLRAGINRQAFTSAASEPLQQAVRSELDGLLRDAARRVRSGGPAASGKAAR